MAANDPRPVKVPQTAGKAAPAASKPSPVEPKKPSITIDEAEMFASRIRPSWELVDDSIRGDLAAEFAAAAVAPKVSPTIPDPEADAPIVALKPGDETPTVALKPEPKKEEAKPAAKADAKPAATK